MLKSFTVSNYKSFDEPQTISFAASKITKHSDHVVKVNNKKILKSCIIFGANASGKSNLMKAVSFSHNVILNGIANVDLLKQNFRIKKDSFSEPAIFEYTILTNDHEYVYGIKLSYDKREIIAEWFRRMGRQGKYYTIFDRCKNSEDVYEVKTDIEDNHHDSAKRVQIYLDDFRGNVNQALRQKTILQDIATRTSSHIGVVGEIDAIYKWFQNVVVIFPDTKYRRINEIAVDDDMRSYFEDMLRSLDTGIEKIDSQEQEMDIEKLFNGIDKKTAEEIRIDISNKLKDSSVIWRIKNQFLHLRKAADGGIVYNKLVLNHGDDAEPFDYNDESDGTKRLFDLIPLLYDNSNDKIILIDEVERSLHTMLVKKFISLFYDKIKNNTSQLIMSTHNLELMDLNLFRQDEIWFVERERESHSSKLFSLMDLKVRGDKVIKKDYSDGVYGAIPRLHSN